VQSFVWSGFIVGSRAPTRRFQSQLDAAESLAAYGLASGASGASGTFEFFLFQTDRNSGPGLVGPVEKVESSVALDDSTPSLALQGLLVRQVRAGAPGHDTSRYL
jgi:hypothetical protein